MLFMSNYTFKGIEGDLTLDFKVTDKQGIVKINRRLNQVDRTERKWSVTTNKNSRYISIKLNATAIVLGLSGFPISERLS